MLHGGIFASRCPHFNENSENIDIANLSSSVILSGVSGLARESTH